MLMKHLIPHRQAAGRKRGAYRLRREALLKLRGDPEALTPVSCLSVIFIIDGGEVTSAPDSLLTLQRPIPSISKIKQVCKRDIRSMSSHQPGHLAGLFSYRMKVIIEHGA